MNRLKQYALLFFLAFAVFSCNETEQSQQREQLSYQCPMDCEHGKTYNKDGTCPVCKMDLKPIEKVDEINGMKDTSEISETSIFNLSSTWYTEENDSIQLSDLKGETLVMVMIYTSCKAACPRLVADMRNIEAQIPEAKKEGIQYILVSIDPENDTPEVLKAFAIENIMDGEEWTFLQGNEQSVREFANVLSVKYKEISPIDFSHSNIISVFDENGELVHQQEGLGVDNKETIDAIISI